MWTRNNLIRCAGIALALIGTNVDHRGPRASSRYVIGTHSRTGVPRGLACRQHAGYFCRRLGSPSPPDCGLFQPGNSWHDTADTYLYYVLGNGKAIGYGIGVGREGFTPSSQQLLTAAAAAA